MSDNVSWYLLNKRRDMLSLITLIIKEHELLESIYHVTYNDFKIAFLA